ncbi:MAG: hypothetical protein EBS01_05860 [Verrucomicrobia bacterium]|nr:hypothetical protein [Verrucomicrobiota bacterium]
MVAMKRILPLLCVLLLASCANSPTRRELMLARAALEAAIPNEPKGNYFVGRRYYKVDYKMWGYVRSPRESWAASRLVMFNEDKMLAPDRAQNAIGSDNGFEYRLYGRFSGEKVYEPASNCIYPEFVLERAELISKTPGPIFTNRRALKPEARFFPAPY